MKGDWGVRPFRRQAGAERFLSPFSAAESPGFQIPSPAPHADHLQVGWGGLLQPLNQLASVTWLREQSQALDKGNIRALRRSAQLRHVQHGHPKVLGLSAKCSSAPEAFLVDTHSCNEPRPKYQLFWNPLPVPPPFYLNGSILCAPQHFCTPVLILILPRQLLASSHTGDGKHALLHLGSPTPNRAPGLPEIGLS